MDKKHDKKTKTTIYIKIGIERISENVGKILLKVNT
jgi:hypothetical protein